MRAFAAFAFLAVLTACTTPAERLAAEQGKALETALQRGRFEMGCPAATAVVLSSQMLEPAVWRGMERAEYTVGIEGCGKRATYVVVCQEGSVSCFAASGRNAPIGR